MMWIYGGGGADDVHGSGYWGMSKYRPALSDPLTHARTINSIEVNLMWILMWYGDTEAIGNN